MTGEDDTTPTEGDGSQEEESTMIPCLACGGAFQTLAKGKVGHDVISCKWCVRGAMTSKQIAAWVTHRQMRGSE